MEIDWVTIAIEAPASALLVIILYKCYRARVRVRYDSECSKCWGMCPMLRLRLEYTAPGQSAPSAQSHSSSAGCSSSSAV